MLLAVISMESLLDELPGNNDDLLTVGDMHARDVHSLCNDVSAMIFPSAITPPTEETISAVTEILISLVSDIESTLHARSETASVCLPGSWQLLAKSGFLREPGLLDYVLARVAEDRLATKLAGGSHKLAAKLLDHADPKIAEAAQALLAADSLHRRPNGLSYKALRPELLHQLCWRIVAAIEVTDGVRNAAVLDNARSLLAGYDEAETAQNVAQKLVHFLNGSANEELGNPDEAGLQLYSAQLAVMLGLEIDHVLQLIDSASIAPLAVMLRAVDNDFEQALTAIYRFHGFSLRPRDIALFNQGFERVETATARAEVNRWANLRSEYLLLQSGNQGATR